jgi:hypothetical protein
MAEVMIWTIRSHGSDRILEIRSLTVAASMDGRNGTSGSSGVIDWIALAQVCSALTTAAWAKVEVITSAGSVFLCQHHHKKHRNSIIAAGHQIRLRLGRS